MSVTKALYDFNLDGGFENCMSFRAGELINLMEKRDDGWWQGSTESSVGWFPGNYVAITEEELPPPPPLEESPALAASSSITPASESTTSSLSSVTAKKIKANSRKSRAFQKARATIDFLPNAYDDDAIGFKKHEEIIIFEQNPTGQWKGKNAEGRVGYFPSRYVDLIDENDDDDDDDDDDDLPTADADDVIVPAKPSVMPVKKEEPSTPVVSSPSSVAAVAAATKEAQSSSEQIPPGWKKAKAPDGSPYFYNSQTYERAWTLEDIKMGPGEPIEGTVRPNMNRDISRSFLFLPTSDSPSPFPGSSPSPVSAAEPAAPPAVMQKPALKQAPSAPGGLKFTMPTTPTTPTGPGSPLVSSSSTDSLKEKERQLENEKKRAEEMARREAEEKKRLEMMLQETQKRLDDEKKRAKQMEDAAEERRRAKEQAEREAAANLERRLKAEAEKKEEEKRKLEEMKSVEEQKRFREQQEREAAEKAKMEQKLRDLERKLEEERVRREQFEAEERRQKELLEQQRLQRQREFEEQQRLFREQEAAERRRFEEEKEHLRKEMEEEKKRMEASIRQKHQAEVEAAKKEQEEKTKIEEKMKKMSEDLARQEQERQKASREAEEKRAMQQKLMEAEASLVKEKKRIEDMEQAKSLMEIERQLEDERTRMEQLMLELSEVDTGGQAAPKVPPKDSLVKQRRLSTFIETIDLPVPPSGPPKLPPAPKFTGAKFPGGAALPPPLTNLPPPPPLTGAVPNLPPPPVKTVPPPGPPPATLPPANLPPPPEAKPKVVIANKVELDKTVSQLSQKTDTHFNLFLQAGRERNLNNFIEEMKESTACIKEILALAANVKPVDSLQQRLTMYMNNVSTSLKSLLLCAKTLANAIEQNQQTIALLLSLEKISSEVLIAKYDTLDYINTNGAAFFGFANPMKQVYEGIAEKMEEHVDTITQSIKFLATVARSQNQRQYQDAAGAVISGASDMRNFLNEEMMKASDFTFKQTLNASLMQLSDSLSLLIQSSNNASRTNNADSVQVMVNCAVKIARLTKDAHTAIAAKAAAS